MGYIIANIIKGTIKEVFLITNTTCSVLSYKDWVMGIIQFLTPHIMESFNEI